MTMSNYTPISMPSLGKIFDMMKNLPPQQAAQDINSPDPAKKLAAMMVTNSDKQLQQQQAAQQQPMPTVAQQLSQGVTQAPGMPTPPMPSVPPQAQAKPAAQGIAALQPAQTPPGSAMGILPPQSAPAPQGNPQGMPVGKAAGGIASFAAGGHATQTSQQQAQIAQHLADLMQGINQSSVAQVPQQAQQAGIAPPQPGQAMPMQNYASMVFGTRPQFRPGTEAAPISQDLSLSQLGQYSAQQPIAAAHGGLMHHVPDHMYKFAHGGILGFKDAGVVPQAQADQADMDASSNPPLRYQSVVDAAHEALQRKGNIYTGQKPTNEQNAAWYNNAPTSPADIQAARVAAWGARQAQPASTPVAAPSAPVDPATAAVLSAMPADMPDSFPGSKTDYLNQRQMALNSVAANNQQQPSALAVGQTSAANTPAIPSPLQLTPTGAGGGQGNRGIAGSISTAPSINYSAAASNPPTIIQKPLNLGAPPAAKPPVTQATGIASGSVTSNTLPPPSGGISDLAQKAVEAGFKTATVEDKIDEHAKAAKKMGVMGEAGDSLAEQAQKFDDEYKRHDKSMEHFIHVLNGIARGGLKGGGENEEEWMTNQRMADQAHAEKYLDMLRQAKDATRGEKKADLMAIMKEIGEDKKNASTLGKDIFNTQTQAAMQHEANKVSEKGHDLSFKASMAQVAASKENEANRLAYEKSIHKTPDDIIAERLKANDENFIGKPYAEQLEEAKKYLQSAVKIDPVAILREQLNSAVAYAKSLENSTRATDEDHAIAAANIRKYQKALDNLLAGKNPGSVESSAVSTSLNDPRYTTK